MSSSITLSAATRQNLLSLQDTASLLSTTQTRLSTGKKVNSALDNPTNFFTSQKLTARSGDLSSLLDGISNGIQAIQAANQGITSMQKLLDTAKSTAQQALADKTGGSGSVLGGSAAQAATVTGTATLSSLGTAGANGPTFDLSSPAKDASLDISLDGGATKTTIRLDKTTLAASVSDLSHMTADQLVSAINGQIAGSGALAGKLTAGTSADGRITFTTTATGAEARVSVAGSANSTLDVGFGKSSTAPTQATVTASAALGTNTDFGNRAGATLTVSDGTRSVVVSLDKDSAIDTLGGKLAPDVTANGATTNLASQANILAAINKQLGDAGSSVVASLGQGADAGKIVFTSADVGPDAQVSVVAGADTTQNVGGGATGLGFTTFTPGGTTPTVSALALGAPPSATLATQTSTQGAAAGANNTPPASNGVTTFSAQTLTANLAVSATQSTTFSVNGTTVTLNAQSPIDSSGTALGSGSLAPARIVQAINQRLTSASVTAQASLSNGALVFTDTRTAGTGSTAPTVVTTGTGRTDQLGLFGTPATTKLGAALPTSIDLSTGQNAAFTIGGNGTTTTVTLGSSSATDNGGGTLGNNPNKSQLVAAINQQLAAGTTSVTAYIDGNNQLAVTGRDDMTTLPTLTGVSDTIGLGFGTAAATTEQGTTTRTPAGTVDLSGGKSSSFSITAGPSGSTQTKTITINAQNLDKSGTALGASASEAKIAEAIQVQLDSTANGATGVAAKVSFVGHSLTVTANAIGTGATVSLTALSDTAGLGLGTTEQTSGRTTAGTGTAAAPVTASGTAATDGSSTATISGSTILSPTAAVAANGNASFNLTLGSGPTKTINIQGAVGGLSAAALVKSINDQIGADTGLAGNVSASLVNGRLSIATTASGSTQKLTVQAGGTADIGFGTATASSGALTGTGTDVGGSKGTSSVRQTLAQQYNNLLGQISQQARDANYNGVNLLYRTSVNASENTLHITFNENNTSALDITGVKFDADGLGLTAVTGGFQSDADITAVISKLNDATTTLRTQSSTFGSNLTVVQNRQDFTKALTTILDTGAANLTNADLNEEAANSQALSTRNSLAISALSLANQVQQHILQLLR